MTNAHFIGLTDDNDPRIAAIMAAHGAKREDRPAPNQISHADECFVQIASVRRYSVQLTYDRREFGSNKAAAEAFANRCNRQVSERIDRVCMRVRWA